MGRGGNNSFMRPWTFLKTDVRMKKKFEQNESSEAEDLVSSDFDFDFVL